jgi:phage terminase large subunit
LKEIRKLYEYPYKSRDAFLDFHRREERWAVLVCHRRAGKTVATIADIIRRAIHEKKPDGRYAYIAPYYAQAKNIAWDYLLKFAEPAIVKANQSELWVELVNGAKIRLFGADNPDNLRGLYLDGVVLDEYADMKPRMWGEIVRPLLTDRKGWATFIGTPKGHNAFYDIYNEAQKNPNWYVKTLRADQSGLLPLAELEDAQATMSDNQYEQEFLCSFEAAILGAYYGQEMRRLTDLERITNIDYDPMFPCHTAWDLGFNDSVRVFGGFK